AAAALLEAGTAGPAAAQAWLNLARGAASLGDARRSIRAATFALRVGAARGEQKVRASAEAVLAEAKSGGRAAELAAGGRPVPPAEGSLEWQLVRCLRGAAVR
ncbi:MAG: hypothetical protein JWM27_1229, partial [Gemmatimonadetes bacterium]|nr:hypothetical protein [Gemmatimonadota bacterium]